MELENWNYISLKTSIVCLLIKIDKKRSEGFRQQLDQFGIFKKYYSKQVLAILLVFFIFWPDLSDLEFIIYHIFYKYLVYLVSYISCL